MSYKSALVVIGLFLMSGCASTDDTEGAIVALMNALTNEPNTLQPRIDAVITVDAAPKAVILLRDALADPAARYAAIKALRMFGVEAAPATSELAQLILSIDKDPLAGAWALSAIEEIGEKATLAVPAVTSLLRHKSPIVRAAAAKTLWRINGDSENAVTVLTAALEACEPSFRWTVIDALATIGDGAQDALPALESALQLPESYRSSASGERSYGITRVSVAKALFMITDQTDPSIEILTIELSNPIAQKEAVDALSLMGDRAVATLPAVRSLLLSEDGSVRLAASLAIISMTKSQSDVAPTLREMLKEGGINRHMALSAMPECGSLPLLLIPELVELATVGDVETKLMFLRAVLPSAQELKDGSRDKVYSVINSEDWPGDASVKVLTGELVRRMAHR